MAKFCGQCGRHRHAGLCDMAELDDGRVVHVSRIDSWDGDIRAEIDAGKTRVKNRWIKKEPKKRAGRE